MPSAVNTESQNTQSMPNFTQKNIQPCGFTMEISSSTQDRLLIYHVKRNTKTDDIQLFVFLAISSESVNQLKEQ